MSVNPQKESIRMAADFTRFDFHAKRFYFSDNVRVMSAEEVGQYILLMVEAWMGGKDASLPDNPKMLARMARVDTVSDAVLAMFPVVKTEHGPRRRNETLFKEWTEAVARSENARKSVNNRWGNEEQPQNERNTTVSTPVILSPSQVGSNQVGSNQVESGRLESSKSGQVVLVSQPRTTGLTEEREAVASHSTEEQVPDFKLFRNVWRSKKLDLGRDKETVNRYMTACSTYGAAKVHAAVDAWATTKTIDWMAASNVRSPFGLFISQLAKTIERMADDKTVDIPMIEADALVDTIPVALATPAAVASTDAAILQMAAEENRQRAARKAKFAVQPEIAADIEKFLD
jgi:uncharacterized protein YdaU (DUF1376 family)